MSAFSTDGRLAISACVNLLRSAAPRPLCHFPAYTVDSSNTPPINVVEGSKQGVDAVQIKSAG